MSDGVSGWMMFLALDLIAPVSQIERLCATRFPENEHQ
jgi:hypothetical protein